MGLEMVTIDVLLATYNGERFLPKQLNSLRRQLRQDFDLRVLMQDDGSIDGTPALLTQAARDDHRFVLAAENGRHLGASDQFISLLRQSDAPYSALCDQDDEWAPDRLLQGYAALREAEAELGPDTPLLIHSDCCLIDEKGSMLHPSFFRHQGWDTHALTLPRLLVQNNATGCTMLMNAALRRLVVSHAQPGRTDMHDWLIALTAAAFGQILMIDLPLVYYRQHAANVTGASADTQLKRSLNALRRREQAQARIRLTYRHTEAFRQLFGPDLPAEAALCIDRYLQTEHLPKLQRILTLYQNNYTMQSFYTRLGQVVFG